LTDLPSNGGLSSERPANNRQIHGKANTKPFEPSG